MKHLQQTIKRFFISVGRVQTVLLMGFVYYLVIGPMALLYQLLKREKPQRESYWVKRDTIRDWGQYLKNQF